MDAAADRMTESELLQGLRDLTHPRRRIDFSSHFAFGDKVVIDDCPSLQGTVTAFLFRSTGYASIEVSWVHNGASCSAYVEEWRLSLVS
jgi:hypothetical protein